MNNSPQLNAGVHDIGRQVERALPGSGNRGVVEALSDVCTLLLTRTYFTSDWGCPGHGFQAGITITLKLTL
ncbi:hypothetical protein J6590_015065 [Homalodisca vitripennis]|nr:hypothetical protein J6590_015065 [Homalodisca vitripennis]